MSITPERERDMMQNNPRVSEAVKHLQEGAQQENIDPRKGLPEDLFLFATSLILLAKVDLFVHNGNKILLAWRGDAFHGNGWHIPGGCIHLKEICEERIQLTALDEIGCKVSIVPKPIMVKEVMASDYRPQLDNQLIRSHNISILYDSTLSESFTINNGVKVSMAPDT